MTAPSRGPLEWIRRNPQWLPYIAASNLHLVLLAAGVLPSRWTQALLMPMLFWPALHVRPPMRWWVLAALGCYWLGDSLPRLLDEPNRFLAMAGSFLVAQLLWICALGNRWSLTLPARKPATVALYLVAAIGIAAVAIPFAGALAPVVALYAFAITVAAVLATSLGELGTWGGALFMVSDALIALNSFIPGFDFGGREVLIMFLYLMGSGLLVGGAARVRDPRRPYPGDTAPRSPGDAGT